MTDLGSGPRSVATLAAPVAKKAANAALGAALPIIARHFDLTDGTSAVIVAYNAGAFATVAVLGALRERAVFRVVVTAMLALFAVGCLGLALAGSWVLFCAAAVIAGCGFGGLGLVLNIAFANGFGAHSVVMVNRVNGLYCIGAVTGPIVVSALGDDFGQLSLALAVLALLCLPAAGFRGTPADNTETMAGPRIPGGYWLLLLCLIGVLYAGVETNVGALLSSQLVWSGWAPGDAALATAGFWAGMVIGRLVLPLLTRAVPIQRLVPAHLAAGAALLALAMVPALTPFAYLAAGIAVAPVVPTLMSWLAVTTEDPQRAGSVLFLSLMAANVVLPATAGQIVGPDAPWSVAACVTAVCVAGTGVALVARTHARSQAAKVVCSTAAH